jgi:hypothetical protein
MLSLAKKLESEDKLDELLPRMKMMAPMTARRFLSLNTFRYKKRFFITCLHELVLNLKIIRGDDDVFSPDLTDEDIKSIFKAVTRPFCWVYGDDDEFYVALNNNITLESIMKRFQAICPLIEMTDIVPGGDHLLRKEKGQLYFCQTVKRFIEHLNV